MKGVQRQLPSEGRGLRYISHAGAVQVDVS